MPWLGKLWTISVFCILKWLERKITKTNKQKKTDKITHQAYSVLGCQTFRSPYHKAIHKSHQLHWYPIALHKPSPYREQRCTRTRALVLLLSKDLLLLGQVTDTDTSLNVTLHTHTHKKKSILSINVKKMYVWLALEHTADPCKVRCFFAFFFFSICL